MRKPPSPSAFALPRWSHLPLCLALGALLSLHAGTDANWDLQNYHLYAPFALLHARLGQDYFAAAYQGYFNPLADVPYYLAKCVALPQAPRLVALLAGLPYGLLVFLVLRLAAVFVPGGSAGVLAALIGVTGETTLSEIGTTFDDIIVTDFVLLAMLLAARRRMVMGGLCLGLAVAMKLTMALFALPLGGMVLVLESERRWRQAAWFCAGAALGFTAGYGWWGWLLWRHFADPFYPMFGRVFHSPWVPPVTPQDPRFYPRSWLQWLAYPFFWLQGRPYIVSEMYLRDPRFALAYAACFAGLWGVIRRGAPPRPVLALWLFFISGYVIWLCGFSILRYAMPLEALTGVFIATTLGWVWPGRRNPWILAVLAVICLGVTKQVSWGRIGYGEALVAEPVPALAPGSLVFMQGRPLGFTVPYLARPGARFVSLEDFYPGTPEWREVQRLLAARPPLRLLTNAQDAAPAGQLGALGLTRAGPCVAIGSAVQSGIALCPLRQTPLP